MSLPGLPPSLWPIRVQPQPGELLSTWIVCLAHAHGLRVESACSALFGPRSTVWTRDIDRSISSTMLGRLGSVSGVDIDVLFGCTLNAFAGVISEEINHRGNSPGILPMGIYHRMRKRHFLMYCPECLKADARPYYRSIWRLSFVTACAQHNLQLLDGCPRCAEPVMPHRVDMKWRLQTTVGSHLHVLCYKCCFDLRWAKAEAATHEETSFVLFVKEALAEGWVDIAGRMVYSPAFFSGINSLTRALSAPVKLGGLDHAPLPTRRLLLSQVGAMLRNWPDAFLSVAAARGWTAVDLAISRKPLPFWIDGVVRQHLLQGYAAISKEEATAILDQSFRRTGKWNLHQARIDSGRCIERRHLGSQSTYHVEDEEFALLLAYIDHEISRENDMQKRSHYFADKVMYTMARLLFQNQIQLSKMTLKDAHGLAVNDKPDFWNIPIRRSDALAWLGWYLRAVRPCLNNALKSDLAFCGQSKSSGLSGSAIGERFRAHVRGAMLGSQIRDFRCLRRII